MGFGRAVQLWLHPQWQSLEEEMGVVLCKKLYQDFWFLFPLLTPNAWLVWLDEPAAKHVCFLLVIKRGVCKRWVFPLLLFTLLYWALQGDWREKKMGFILVRSAH